MTLPDEWAPLLQRIDEWSADPIRFAREALAVSDLDPWQVDFLSNLRSRPRITVRAGRGVAKSFTIAIATMWKLFCFSPSKVLFTAPKADTVQDVIWSEMEILRRGLPQLLQDGIVIQADSIYIRGLERINFAIIRTARPDNPDALRGAHSENMTVICEEASGIADSAFEVLEGTMTTPGSQMILVGNMSRTSGYFYNSHFTDKSILWHKIRVNAEDVAANGHRWYDPDFVRAKKDKYGVDSDQYAIEVRGDPPSAEEGTVIPRHLVEAAMYRDIEMFKGYIPVWGLDIGRWRDRSALAKRCGNVLLEPIMVWRIPDAVDLAEAVKEHYDEVEHSKPELLPSEILVDVIGMGGPVLDLLRRFNLPARGVNVAEAHSTRDRYLRKRDELWFRAREWFSRRDTRIAHDDDFIGEVSSVRWTLTQDGKQKVESKDDMRSAGRDSPDLADAFVLTFAGGQIRLPENSNPERYKFQYKGLRRTGGAPSWMSI